MAGLVSVLREQVHYEGDIRPDARLLDGLNLDSLQLMTLVVETENLFSVVIDDGAESSIATLDDLADYICALKGPGVP